MNHGPLRHAAKYFTAKPSTAKKLLIELKEKVVHLKSILGSIEIELMQYDETLSDMIPLMDNPCLKNIQRAEREVVGLERSVLRGIRRKIDYLRSELG